MSTNNLPPPGGGEQTSMRPFLISGFRNRTGSCNDDLIHNILEKQIPNNVITSTCITTTTTTSVATTTASTMCYPYTTSSVLHLNRPKMSVIENSKPRLESNSKRKSSPPIKTVNASKSKKQKTLKSWLSAPDKPESSNRFDLFSSDDSDCEDVDSVPKPNPPNVSKQPKPPPIYLQDVEYISTLTSGLDQVAEGMYQLKILNNNEVKIQSTESENYSSIIKLLDEKNTRYYTYKPKQQRGFKVVLRNTHYSTNKDEIVSELLEKGHKVTNINNILQRQTKKPLSLFHIELESNPTNKDIYQITNLLHCKISFEPPHHKRVIPQCSNCQKYGHTKNFCHMEPACVKCAGKHRTAECKKPINDSSVKCVLCNGSHTANYKGCEIYKSLKIQRFPPLRKNIEPQTIPQNTAPGTTNPQSSYAETVKQVQPTEFKSDMTELKDMIKQLVNQISAMMNILTMLVAKQNAN